jgi:hypothetical protein
VSLTVNLRFLASLLEKCGEPGVQVSHSPPQLFPMTLLWTPSGAVLCVYSSAKNPLKVETLPKYWVPAGAVMVA